jgi:uncharacterized protein involved in exopolysaccharide biosynthesis
MNVSRAPEAHLRDYLRVLRKHRWLLSGCALLIIVTVAISTFMQVRIYEASATILIEPETAKVLNFQEVMPLSASEDYYRTQYEIIKSRPVIEKVIASLNLKQRMPELARAQDPVQAVSGLVSVEPRRMTRLLYVKATHPDPTMAAELANALAASYIKYNLEAKLKGARDALTWLTDQMGDLKQKVQDSSTALQNYRVKVGILGMQEQRQITAQKIMDFNKAYLEAQAQRLSIEAKLREIGLIAKDRSGAQSIFTVADNALIQKLKQEASELEVQRSKLLKTYKDKHPEVVKVDAQMQQVQQRIDSEMQTMLRGVQTEYKVARAREETLLGNVNQLRREGQDLNEKEIQYLNLQRDSDSNQQLYEAVLKRLKETGITGGLESNNVRIVEEARVPHVPILPRRSMNLFLSVVAGLGVGVGVVLTVEYFDTTMKSPEEVERALGIPVVGIVPAFGGRRS